ncbi:unnamed protein product [Euphydryas editha]|uniref:Uncharacterized protein n=1 Tax=Euphydryas editha TaxID=104508 RepID=A0AAU9U6Z2_EUPED|nr:unnamed protein product [Euphydryas editha]
MHEAVNDNMNQIEHVTFIIQHCTRLSRRRARPYHCDAFHFSFRRAAACERSRVGSGTPCITAGFAKRSVQRAARLEIRRTASPVTRALHEITERRPPSSTPVVVHRAVLALWPTCCGYPTISSSDFMNITFACVRARFPPKDIHAAM